MAVPALNRLARQRMAQRLRLSSEFDAFVLDHFENCLRLIPEGGDRVAKENVLLRVNGAKRILRAIDGPIWWSRLLLWPLIALIAGGGSVYLWYVGHNNPQTYPPSDSRPHTKPVDSSPILQEMIPLPLAPIYNPPVEPSKQALQPPRYQCIDQSHNDSRLVNPEQCEPQELAFEDKNNIGRPLCPIDLACQGDMRCVSEPYLHASDNQNCGAKGPCLAQDICQNAICICPPTNLSSSQNSRRRIVVFDKQHSEEKQYTPHSPSLKFY